MYVIVGLGNPGRQYSQTRHNVGFMAIDYLADLFRIDMNQKKHKAVCGTGMIDGQKVLLVKPQTFMNLSGESVRSVIDFYKTDISEELIVIYDDTSLDAGQLRIRKKGSAGGHNGIKSIIAHLGTQQFQRIKIGIGEKPQGYDLADYVLGKFPREESCLIEDVLKRSSEVVRLMTSGETDQAMNVYNKKVE